MAPPRRLHPSARCGSRTAWAPISRVIGNEHSNQDGIISLTGYLQGDRSYTRADSLCRFNVVRMLVFDIRGGKVEDEDQEEEEEEEEEEEKRRGE